MARSKGGGRGGGHRALHFMTSNDGKHREVKAALEPLGMTVHRTDIEYPEVQADTLEEVAFFAMDHLKEEMEGDFLIEDSGLFIEPLGGFPGVYSAYVLRTIGNRGILRLLEGRGEGDRGATFRSCFGIFTTSGGAKVVSGECKGTISIEVRGKGGFGYDPIFVPEGDERTFAEMAVEEKNAVSHRGRALKALLRLLE